jgi:hypothetical protein
MPLLRKADAILAAALIGLGAAPLASSFLCAESSCRSARDGALFYGVGLLAALIVAPLFWRARRWWHRVFLLAGALYLSYLLPAWADRHGRWTIPLLSGKSCVVRAGETRDDVDRSCGTPTYRCDGPKYADSDLWNPFSLNLCGFSAHVYGNRFVVYGCRGGVASVTGFEGGPPEQSRPPHCVTWRP